MSEKKRQTSGFDYKLYTAQWKKKNLTLLKKAVSISKKILKNPRKYKNFDSRLLGDFMEKLTISAEAIGLLSGNYFEGEIITLAGTMIEGFSFMQYCLKNKKSEKYFEYLAIQSLKIEYKKSEVLNPNSTKKVPQIEHDIKILENLKDKYLKSNKNYNEVMSFLKSKNNSPVSKRKMIISSYKKFHECSIESMVNEFIENDSRKIAYEQYCQIKHHHFSNSFLYPETNSRRKEFSPFDELNAITSAFVILDKVLNMYKEMKERGYIEEKYQIPSQI